jgi:hypothetical protein
MQYDAQKTKLPVALILIERAGEIEKALNSHSSENVHGKLDYLTLTIITDYAASDIIYKNLASVITGNVSLYPNYPHMTPKSKDSEEAQLRWNSNDTELFVMTKVHSDESATACRCLHGENCERGEMGYQETWQDIHPRLSRFPALLPLRFFINSDGSFKQPGDTITLRYQGKPVVLTCTYTPEFFPDEPTPPTTLAEGLAYRVSFASTFIRDVPTYVTQAKAAAISGEWISSD